MPRFYIDTYDGTSFNADQQGVILKDRAAARYAAIDRLPDIARQGPARWRSKGHDVSSVGQRPYNLYFERS